MKKLKVLVACEESQAVTKEFRSLGHEAYSCDILPCSGGHPEWHIQGDMFDAFEKLQPDVVIAFPPCTYLTVSANAHFLSNPDRWVKRLEAIQFVWKIMQLPVKYLAVENPKGVISSYIRKPDQYIHPYQFGDPEIKMTGLWLRELPKLTETNIVEPEFVLYKSSKNKSGFSKYGKITGTNPSTNNPENAKLRSKTYLGIAKAMAEQWSEYLLKELS